MWLLVIYLSISTWEGNSFVIHPISRPTLDLTFFLSEQSECSSSLITSAPSSFGGSQTGLSTVSSNSSKTEGPRESSAGSILGASSPIWKSVCYPCFYLASLSILSCHFWHPDLWGYILNGWFQTRMCEVWTWKHSKCMLYNEMVAFLVTM